MAIYLGNTPIAENVTIQQGGGVTIDDTLSDTSKNPVQNKVITNALNTKANLTDIPTSLPADGGNADTIDGKHASDFVQKSGDSMSGNLRMETNQLWFGTDGISQFCFEDTNGDLNLKNHDGTTVFAANYHGSFATNADTVDGKHAESFMQWLGTPDDSGFMNDANYQIDYHCTMGNGTMIGLPIPGWYHIVYYHQVNAPGYSGYGMQIAYPLNFDGATMIRWSDGITWKDWTNIADGGNADTVDGKHASDFALKTDIPTSLPANGGNAATVNGHSVNSDVPAGAKFTDTVYTHPSYTARTGVPTANVAPAFGGTFTVSQPVSDATGHITAINSRTITIPSTAASASAAGLVSTGAQTLAGNKTFNGQVIPAGASAVGTAQARKIYAGTSDMTAGTTKLETGAIYLVYE